MSRLEGNKMETSGTKKTPLCICNCGKEYTTRAGLWKHKKKCLNESTTPNIEENDLNDLVVNKELIMMILKQNQDMLKENSELKHMMIDTQTQMFKVIENGTHNHTNSHNKSFNLQFFLNETCKNAMNITEFVDSLQLQLSDLEKVGEVGYIEGISNIIIKKLNALDISERPIHCTDKKRETMYIRDEDKWEKEDDKHMKMHKMVRKVANKNINLISEFQKLYPDWKKSTSKYSDQINKIIIESMGGKGDNEYDKEEKIIKRVAREVFVDKIL
jgi:vacuolar-type H+-ATPase subunit F/Vma7